jgi:UDP:flavonoid glycosyltransferase YjiC (YdhE family)
MANVLLAWELGSGLGHCVKLAPLATDLIARGHRVYFAARDAATAQKVVQNAAIKFVPVPGLSGTLPNPMRRPRSFAQVLEQVGFGNDMQLQLLVDCWRNLFELVQPRLVVCEHSPVCLLASRWTAARRVVLGTGFSLPPDASPLPDLCPWGGPPPVDLASQEHRLLARVNRLLARDGHPVINRLAQFYADVDHKFLLTFCELDHHGKREHAEYLGSWAPRGGVEPHWPEGDGPRVFAYLKSLPEPFRLESTIAALRELPVRTLAHIPSAPQQILKLQSRSLRISAEPVDIQAALRNCDVAVLNGTSGTATQSLLAGVPVLLVPHYLEQVVFSRRVVELGAGLVVEPNRIELFVPRLWRLLRDDQYRRAAQSFAARYSGFDAEQCQKQVIDRVVSLLNDELPATTSLPNDTRSSTNPQGDESRDLRQGEIRSDSNGRERSYSCATIRNSSIPAASFPTR